MHIDILSLFPAYFRGPFDESILKRAKQRGKLDINLIDIRDFADNKHRRVDDRPYGGGPGMLMMPGPVVRAIDSVRAPAAKLIYLSPQGKVLTAAKCRELASHPHLILLCGHYEGIDQRIIESEEIEEVSIGDYVLTSGCAAAVVLVEGVVRFIPGVLGHAEAANEDSFEGGRDQMGILDCPHYTRPEQFKEMHVPEVLLSGNHQEIAKWRKAQAIHKTKRVRPDLLKYLGD
ncbi:MAG: tRNA (guanosine(37)-N1)-methyltransferase TrmD [Parachlamydiaceae bacterium]|nr:tRNA (guanosine(37)-N1)-methyltransferase TrmD [Parachlamydiaceae bacterium]